MADVNTTVKPDLESEIKLILNSPELAVAHDPLPEGIDDEPIDVVEDKLFGDHLMPDEDDIWDMSGVQHRSSCQMILYQTLSAGGRVRVWDLLILLPNLVFLAFLLLRFRRSCAKLRSCHLPILSAFHFLVLSCSTVSVLRCVASMVAAGFDAVGPEETADRILWLALRFFLLATETSVLAFALLSGHLDKRSSIRRMVLIAAMISLTFAIVQASLELASPDPAFYVLKEDIRLFGHGGMGFWTTYSAIFSALYALVLALPFLPCRHWVSLPRKKSFYYYAGFLLVLNVVQALGGGLVACHKSPSAGLCLVNLTTYLYFVAFVPVVYFTFLYPFFSSDDAHQQNILFVYKAQTDDTDADDLAPITTANDHSSLFSLGSSSAAVDVQDAFDNDQDQNTPIVINGSLSFTPQQN